jgi:transposase
MSKLTKREQKKVIRLREAGKTFMEIAELLGISTSFVYTVIRQLAPHLLGSRYKSVKEQYGQIVAEYQEGLTLKELSEKYGVSFYFITNAKREAKKKTKKNLPTSLTEHAVQIAAEYQEGATYKELAEKYGLSVHHITEAVKSQKVKEEQKQIHIEGRRKKRYGIILKMYQEGCSVRDIRDQLNISVRTVRHALRHFGITPPRYEPPSCAKTERNQELIEARRNGQTLLELSERFQISTQRVSDLVTKYNKTAENPIAPPINPKRWIGTTPESKELWKQIIQWHRSGLSNEQIAEKLQIRFVTFCNVIYRYRKTFAKELYQKNSKKI